MSKGIKRKTTHRKGTHKKKRILILEDDVIIADSEKGILKGEGFEVEVANDGVEGLEKIKQREIHEKKV